MKASLTIRDNFYLVCHYILVIKTSQQSHLIEGILSLFVLELGQFDFLEGIFGLVLDTLDLTYIYGKPCKPR